MAAGDVVGYMIRVGQQRHQVATIDQIRATYPQAYIVGEVVEAEIGGSIVREYEGPQLYEQVQEKTVKELRSELEERGVEIPKGAKKEDLVELVQQPPEETAPVEPAPAQPVVEDAQVEVVAVVEEDPKKR